MSWKTSGFTYGGRTVGPKRFWNSGETPVTPTAGWPGRRKSTTSFTIDEFDDDSEDPIVWWGDVQVSLDAGQNESNTATWLTAPGDLYTGTAFEFVGVPTDVATSATTGVGTFVWQNATNADVGGVVPGRWQFQSGTDFNTLGDNLTRTIRQQYRVRYADGSYSGTNDLLATVRGTASPVDVNPVMTDISISVDAGQEATYTLITNTTDSDNNISGWFIASQPIDSNDEFLGSVSLESDGTYDTGLIRVTTGSDFNDVTFGNTKVVTAQVYAVDEESNISDTVNVTITVSGVSSGVAPVASDGTNSVDADGTIVNASVPTPTDADGDLNANGYASPTVFSPALDGVFVFRTDGTYDYDPNGVFNSLQIGQTATRSFTYTASDDANNVSNQKTVTITIHGKAAAATEPTYPGMAALNSKYPWEAGGMTRFMQLPQAFPAAATAVQSGDFSDPNTWGGTVPTSGNWKVPYGLVVTFDEALEATVANNTAFGFVEIHGTLKFATSTSTRLRCDTLWGSYGSHLIINPDSHTVETEISIIANGDIDVTKDPAVLSRGVLWHGTLDVKGFGAGTASEKDPFLDCPHGSHPVSGENTVSLSRAPVGWDVGDKLIIPQTEMDDPFLATPTREEEEVTITNIVGSTITFTPSLTYDHDDLEDADFTTPVKDFGDGTGTGGDRPTLAICNMTRQIRFVSEGADSIPDYQRPHSMFMHRTTGANIYFHGVEVRYFGRTRKIQRAFTGGELNGVAPDAQTNLKSRYPVHLHWLAFDPETELLDWTNLPVIRCNVVYGSPGWGFAHHRAASITEDNISYDTFCAFASETGDEIGRWSGNIAIKMLARRLNGTTGRIINTKDGQFINHHDLWATGQAYGLSSRQIIVTSSARGWNRAYGSEGDTFSWMHRLGTVGYISSTQDVGLTPVDARNWRGENGEQFGGALAYSQWTSGGQVHPDQPAMPSVEHLQATACWRGYHVIKSGPSAGHDVRIFFDDFIATGCAQGLEWQYTGHYSARRFLLSHSTRYTSSDPSRHGFLIYNNTPDMSLMYGKIGGFYEGIRMKHQVTTSTDPIAGAWQYVVDSVQFGSQANLTNNTEDWPSYLGTITGGDGVSGTEDLAYNMTFVNPQTGQSQTFGAQPNAYNISSQSFDFYRTSKAADANSFTVATEWDWSIKNYEIRGVVTDAFGDREVPSFYGTSGALTSKNNSFDIMSLDRDHMGWLLVHKGYWRTTGGVYYTEHDFWFTPRQIKNRTKMVIRIPLASNVPGTQGNGANQYFPNGWGAQRVFVDNGVKD